MHNEELKAGLAELKLYGIKPRWEYTEGTHIRIIWQVPGKDEVRVVHTSKTGSDWRGPMNLRSEVRKLLRADNVDLDMHKKKAQRKEPSVIAKALAIPEQVTPIPEQILAMRSELGDLTQLVIKLAKTISILREVMAGKPVEAPPPPKPQPLSVRSVKLVEYLNGAYVSMDALARDTGLPTKVVKQKLVYLVGKGKVEIFRGGARLKVEPPPPGKKGQRQRVVSH